MKITITGSNGFVGSYAVKYFGQKNEIVAFQRKKDEIIGNIQYIKWDLRESYSSNIDCDIFIHSAADTGYGKSRGEMIEQNVSSCKNILDKVNISECKHFIHISSSSVYQGISGVIDESAQINENNLINSYSYSKYMAEKYIKEHLRPDIKLTILRPRAIYGAGDMVLEPSILKHQIFGRLLLIGNGKNITSLTDINYFIQAIEMVIQKQGTPFEIYNIAEEKTKTMGKIYEELVKKYSLKGVIAIPIFLLKIFYFLNPNKISYLLDSFGSDKVLNIGKYQSIRSK